MNKLSKVEIEEGVKMFRTQMGSQFLDESDARLYENVLHGLNYPLSRNFGRKKKVNEYYEFIKPE